MSNTSGNDMMQKLLNTVKKNIEENKIQETGSAAKPKGHPYFTNPVENARKPDFANFKKRKMVAMSFTPYKETDDYLDDKDLDTRNTEKDTFKNLLDALHAKGYTVSYTPDRPAFVHPLTTILEAHEIKKFVVIAFPKALPPSRHRDIDIISAEMVEIAAWRLGAVKDEGGLYINTIPGSRRGFQGATIALFLGADCKSPVEFCITYSDSGAEISDQINYSNKEYNTNTAIKTCEALHIPIYNFRNGRSLMRLITMLKEPVAPTAAVVKEIDPTANELPEPVAPVVEQTVVETPVAPVVEQPTPESNDYGSITDDTDIPF